jgi:hypothetical protein
LHEHNESEIMDTTLPGTMCEGSSPVNQPADLSATAMALLERAREHRAAAERARRLASSIATEAVVFELDRYAADLEQTAQEIERRAYALVEETLATWSEAAAAARLGN